LIAVIEWGVWRKGVIGVVAAHIPMGWRRAIYRIWGISFHMIMRTWFSKKYIIMDMDSIMVCYTLLFESVRKGRFGELLSPPNLPSRNNRT